MNNNHSITLQIRRNYFLVSDIPNYQKYISQAADDN